MRMWRPGGAVAEPGCFHWGGPKGLVIMFVVAQVSLETGLDWPPGIPAIGHTLFLQSDKEACSSPHQSSEDRLCARSKCARVEMLQCSFCMKKRL